MTLSFLMKRSNNHLTGIVTFLTALLIVSCSGAAPEPSGETVVAETAGIVLAGRIDVPPLEAVASLSRTRFAKKDDADQGVKGHVYTLQGGDIGEFEADKDGNFSLPTSAAELAGGNASGSFDVAVVVAAENGLQKYEVVHHDAQASGTQTLPLGTTDIMTTLATEAIAQQIEGFSGWGQDYASEAGEGFSCLYELQESLWLQADPEAENVGQGYGLFKQLAVYLVAQGQSFSDLGYGSWGALFADINSADDITGLMNGGVQFNVQGLAADPAGGAAETFEAVDSLLAELVAEDFSSGGGAVCGNITSGMLDPAVFIAPIVAAEDIGELEVYDDPAVVEIHVGMMLGCLENDGCAGVKENASAILDALNEYQEDLDAFFAPGGAPDTQAIQELVAVAKICGGGSKEEQSDCVKEKHEESEDLEDESDGEDSAEAPATNAAPAAPSGNGGAQGGEAKVLICHIPPGNPANPQEIEVAPASVPHHLEHGDHVGPCADPVVPEPEPEEPVAEEPVAEEPIAEEPVAEEPVVEEPVAEEPVAEEPVAEEPVVEAPVAEEPVAEEPVTEEPVAEEPVAEEPEVCSAPQGGITAVWSHAFGHIYGGFYRMIPGPSAAIADVRPDLPGLEVATGNEEYYPLGYWGGPKGRWFLFEADGSVVFWKDTENDEAHSSVNVFDLDGNGTLEMLGGTTSGNQVQAFTGTGSWFWRYILGGHSISTPTVASLIPGGAPLVFNGSMDYKVRSIDGKTGQLKWAFDTGKWIWSTPAVADLDGDNHQEVVIANDGQYSGASVLYNLSAATGTVNWQKTLGTKVRASAAVADVDGDGVKEILIGDNTGVFKAYDGETGAIEWGFSTGGEILSSAAVGDMDGDGDLETVFGSADGKVYALNGNGTLFWSRSLGGAVHSSPALARRTPCGPLHVYVTTMAGELAVLNGADGQIATTFHVGYEMVSSPVVGDVDGDGRLEVFFQDRRGDLQGMQGDVFWEVRDEGSSVAPFKTEWPLFRADPAHTGVYPGEE